jgi:hypothetical protein
MTLTYTKPCTKNRASGFSSFHYSFKEILMGRHKRNLDRVYYDANNDKSREKIVLEYLKAVDTLTINEEYRLKKKISEYEEKIKDVPRVEQLQAQLANRIIEEESIKQQVKKLQQDKESEIQAMKEQMGHIMTLIQQNPKLANIKQEVLISKGL